jgi:hypothetical protein
MRTKKNKAGAALRDAMWQEQHGIYVVADYEAETGRRGAARRAAVARSRMHRIERGEAFTMPAKMLPEEFRAGLADDTPVEVAEDGEIIVLD